MTPDDPEPNGNFNKGGLLEAKEMPHLGRRGGFEGMICASSGVLLACAGGLQSMTQISSAQAATAATQAKTKIPIIVKDRTSFFWRTVLAGARKVAILHCTSEVPVLDEPRS